MLDIEKFAEHVWLIDEYEYLTREAFEEALARFNLRYRQGKTFSDVRIAFGRASGSSIMMHKGRHAKYMETLLVELDKIVIRSNWDL